MFSPSTRRLAHRIRSHVRRLSTTSTTNVDVESYQRNGAVILRNLLTTEQVEVLRKGIDWNLANPGPLAGVASRDSDPGRFFEDFCNWQRSPEYQDVIFNSAIPHVAAQLMQSHTVRLYHDHLLVKEPQTVQPTPWHQDQPYYNVEGSQNVSFWLPVDPVPHDASLQFVAGSHTGVWYMPKTFLTEQAKWFPDGSLQEVPDIEGDPESHEVLCWDLQPGDAVAFHMLTLHGSQGSSSLRRAFSVRVMGDDMRHAPRSWRTSPEFDGLAEELAAGAPMEHPRFPLLHP